MSPRLYGLFWRKRGARRWTRAMPMAYTKPAAISRYQSLLISGAFRSDVEVELRVTTKRLHTAQLWPPQAVLGWHEAPRGWTSITS